ncbi:mixed lineage kinase domain-like protein isoform X2 [Thalassophryne amazonica]|uniref:mixed lineage kinase domain-like protein isoform X2 n=1 Tax=Thalassophryne amazonica TaxID=390379 RepID=UPI00147127F0|nr:mixed lineage kinase domain-like protein isoform X2 [Thalassophryne amazonica]
MDLVDPILSMVLEIHSLVENVKANKKRCCRVAKRVNALEELLKSIKKRARSQISADVHQALRELKYTLESAQNLIRKYASANLVERILKSSSHGDEFSSINERLNDAFQILSGALQVEHRDILYRVFEATSRMREDEDDGKEDDAELKTINKPSVMSEVIRMIKPQELKYSYPKEPFMKTPTSEVYKGEFHGFTVAIKRYTDLINTSPGEIRAVFNKEVETMKRFESPNILRMFGICVQDEDGPKPQFLIVMEYCEKGSLREVLDSSCKLSWTRKARMCWDAARGLYRLHQTEEKSKVHGCINSNKFLVAQGYRVKLGGFELAKTETSLKKMTKGKEIKSLCYSCPQKLSDINHPYSKDCEIYSFGIVLWEIATRKKPFDGCSSQQIYDKVCVEKCPEPLPEDCPDALGELVNACRAFESFSRPSAGVLVDKLQCMVESLEDK